MQPLIQPNWHIAVVHFPIALLVVGVLLEVCSFLGWRRSGIRRAARWMVLVGAVLAVPVTYSGIRAYAQQYPGGLDSIADPVLREVMFDHIWQQSVATGVALLMVVVWVALSDRWRATLHIPIAVVLLGVVFLTLVGAHHGGKLVYDHATGVKEANAGSDGGEIVHNTDAPGTGRGAIARYADTAAEWVPPIELHVNFAGLTMALAAVALGLAARAISEPADRRVLTEADSEQRIAAAFTPGSGEALRREAPAARAGDTGVDGGAIDIAPDDSGSSAHGATNYGAAGHGTAGYGAAGYGTAGYTRQDFSPSVYGPNIPAGRFWLLATLLALLTAAGGIWMLAHDQQTWDPQRLWETVRDRDLNGGAVLTRRLTHVVLGGSILVLTLFLAIFSRFAGRSKLLLWLFGSLLVIALAAQLWLGLLLILTGADGPLTAWKG